ncbi:MAG TPA: CBS domain-containing protein [Bryobacteraceae bacterium]
MVKVCWSVVEPDYREGDMTTVAEVMTRDPVTISPFEGVRQAVKMMDTLNVGVLPVCDGAKLVGMLTDRDIDLRGVAAGIVTDSAVESVLRQPLAWCFEDDDVIEVRQRMAREQIRRLPVVDREKRLVGIIALGDIANTD